MFIQLKNNENYLEGNRERIAKIGENIKKVEQTSEIIEHLFKVDNINKIKNILEDELFFEYIPKWLIKKFYDNIKQEKFTREEFINEYIITGEDGMFGVCTMLDVL